MQASTVQIFKVKQDLEAIDQLLSAIITSLLNDATLLSQASKMLIAEFFQYLVDHRDTLASLDRNGNQVTDYKIYSVFDYGVYLFDSCSCKKKSAYLKHITLALNAPLLLRAWTYEFETGKWLRVDLETGVPTEFASGPMFGQYLAGDFVNGEFYFTDQATRQLRRLSEDGSTALVGSLPVDQPNPIAVSLQHDVSTGTTYYINGTDMEEFLYEVNVTTGMFTDRKQITKPTEVVTISLVIDSAGKAYVLDLTDSALYDFDLNMAMVTGPPRKIYDSVTGNPIDINFGQESDFSCGSDGKLYGMLILANLDVSNNRTLFGTIEIQSDKAVFTKIAGYPNSLRPFAIDC